MGYHCGLQTIILLNSFVTIFETIYPLSFLTNPNIRKIQSDTLFDRLNSEMLSFDKKNLFHPCRVFPLCCSKATTFLFKQFKDFMLCSWLSQSDIISAVAHQLLEEDWFPSSRAWPVKRPSLCKISLQSWIR